MWSRVHIHKPKTASPLSKKVLQVILWLYVIPGAYTQTKDSKSIIEKSITSYCMALCGPGCIYTNQRQQTKSYWRGGSDVRGIPNGYVHGVDMIKPDKLGLNKQHGVRRLDA
jgi:hypothetical protein